MIPWHVDDGASATATYGVAMSAVSHDLAAFTANLTRPRVHEDLRRRKSGRAGIGRWQAMRIRIYWALQAAREPRLQGRG